MRSADFTRHTAHTLFAIALSMAQNALRTSAGLTPKQMQRWQSDARKVVRLGPGSTDRISRYDSPVLRCARTTATIANMGTL